MADMSSSLKVVNIALVFCASFSLLAIFILILFILTLCSLLVPAISLVGSAGGILSTGAAPAAGARGGMGGGGGGACSCRLGTTRTQLQREELGAGGDGGSVLHQQLGDGAGARARHRHGGLVRLHLAQDLVLGDGVAHRLLPPDVALGDGVGEGRTDHHLYLITQDSGGEDAPPHHRVLVGKAGEGRGGSLDRLHGGGGEQGEVADIPGLLDMLEHAPGQPARTQHGSLVEVNQAIKA